MNVLTQVWKVIKAFFGRLGDPPPEPIYTPPDADDQCWAFEEGFKNRWTEPRKGIVPAHEVEKVFKQLEIRHKNATRRTEFSNAKHFKRRQPTTARMLWKPDAKLEEED